MSIESGHVGTNAPKVDEWRDGMVEQVSEYMDIIKDIGCVSHGRETCLDELAETYGEDDACHNGDGLCDAGTHAR